MPGKGQRYPNTRERVRISIRPRLGEEAFDEMVQPSMIAGAGNKAAIMI